MTIYGRISVLFICTCLLSLLVMPAISAVSPAVIGETIHLSGKGGGYDNMYLFLTGPNLASNGVRLDSITSPVVSGNAASFTRVPVRDGMWEYEWDTGRTGGTLDAGSYLIWVVPRPLDRYDLGDTSYATQSVLLTNPVLTADISGTGGTEETAEETAPVPDETAAGDGDGSNTTRDEPEVAPRASGGTAPLPTTAGLFSYPCLCAAGIAVFFLLCIFRNE